MTPEINLIDLGDQNYSIEFTYPFTANQQEVWSYFTNKELLHEWLPELTFDTLKVGQKLIFNSGEKTEKKEELLAFDAPRLLSYTWDIGFIKFELASTNRSETFLAFQNWLPIITEYTAKDIYNWLLRMETVERLINKDPLPKNEDRFAELYPYIKEQLNA